ncbi:putative 5-formyltetrahydrofolate cyclo-ligase [bacterium BMS3Bbin07]|nr:putative 5-formyltetrahydrofolate cyclo-ligase [bacterium BMS3Bbin07]
MYKEKSRLRAEVIRKRDSIPLEVRKAKDRMIRERLSGLTEYRNAGTVMLFASFRTEVDTIPIIADALTEGKRVVLPKVDGAKKELRLYNIRSVDELIPGYMGIPEPGVVEGREVAPEELELIVMPGVAFDERGGRLGYGGGYYDRLIAGIRRRPPLVAVAYEEQVVPEVPVADHDIRVDRIVTDRRVITVCAS